jgi:hypothetical protein
MFPILRGLWRILFYFKDYRPQPVSIRAAWRWLSQYPFSVRNRLLMLLDQIIYFSEQETVDTLVSLNHDILNLLAADGMDLDKVIYVSIDSAGSSSQVMLNLLRDAENLERKRARLIDSRDTINLSKITAGIGSGAIIYVDDFAGTGKQFRRNRNWAAQYILGTFSEFFLVPVICEEAYQRIEALGIVPIYKLMHMKHQRALHRDSEAIAVDIKDQITGYCKKINPNSGLGFDDLATMVVFYRNAPNTMPLIFRGSLKQNPYRGIFPRSDDLEY